MPLKPTPRSEASQTRSDALSADPSLGGLASNFTADLGEIGQKLFGIGNNNSIANVNAASGNTGILPPLPDLATAGPMNLTGDIPPAPIAPAAPLIGDAALEGLPNTVEELVSGNPLSVSAVDNVTPAPTVPPSVEELYAPQDALGSLLAQSGVQQPTASGDENTALQQAIIRTLMSKMQ